MLFCKSAEILHTRSSQEYSWSCSGFGAAGVHFVYYFCTQKFRFCSQNCGTVLRTLFLYTKNAFCEPEPRECTSRTTVVLKVTIFKPELQSSSRAACVLETYEFSRSCGNAHTEPLRRARSLQRVRCGQDKLARRHGESASTRTISAEGSLRSRQIRTAPQRERSSQRGTFRKLPSALPRPEKEEELRVEK